MKAKANKKLLTCYHIGIRKYADGGWCNYKGRCKSKCRVYEEGPRGGMRRTDSFMCQEAI